MPLDEAYKILNVKPGTSPEELQTVGGRAEAQLTALIHMMQRFESMFKANDRQAGGSFYLQSKIVRARERIEIDGGRAAAP